MTAQAARRRPRGTSAWVDLFKVLDGSQVRRPSGAIGSDNKSVIVTETGGPPTTAVGFHVQVIC